MKPVSTSDASWIDKPFSFVFIDFVLVRVSRDEDIDIELPLNHRQAVSITPRNYLVPMDQPDFKLSNLNDFGFREGGVVVEFATHYMYIWRQSI